MSVSVVEVGEAGRGVIALTNLKAGELLAVDSAVVALPGNMGVREAGREILRQVKKMNNIMKEKFYNLTRNKYVSLLCADLRKENLGEHSRAKKLGEFSPEISIFFNNNIATDDNF